MGIYTLEEAIEVVAKSQGYSLSHSLAQNLHDRIRERLESDIPYPDALRYSLNDLRIFDKKNGMPERRIAKSVMGKLFGSRGGRATARNRKRGTRRAAAPQLPAAKRPFPTTVDKKGQKRWEF